MIGKADTRLIPTKVINHIEMPSNILLSPGDFSYYIPHSYINGTLPCRWTMDQRPWRTVLLGVNCTSDVPNITSDTCSKLLGFPLKMVENVSFLSINLYTMYCNREYSIVRNKLLPIVTSLQDEPLLWHNLSWGTQTHCPSQSSDSHRLTKANIPWGSFLNFEWTIGLDKPTFKINRSKYFFSVYYTNPYEYNYT